MTGGHWMFLWISRRRSKFFNHFILSSSSRRDISSASIIAVIVSRSCRSSVLDSISFNIRGTRMTCWTGETRRSVNCSFLHRGSRLHHWKRQTGREARQRGRKGERNRIKCYKISTARTLKGIYKERTSRFFSITLVSWCISFGIISEERRGKKIRTSERSTLYMKYICMQERRSFAFMNDTNVYTGSKWIKIQLASHRKRVKWTSRRGTCGVKKNTRQKEREEKRREFELSLMESNERQELN